MRKSISILLENPDEFKHKLIHFVNEANTGIILDSAEYYKNSTKDFLYHNYALIAGIGVLSEFTETCSEHFEKLRDYHFASSDWIFGHLAYDLKNHIEKLQSKHLDNIGFPDIHFFQPEWILLIEKNKLSILFPENYSELQAKQLLESIYSIEIDVITPKEIVLQKRFSHEEYINAVEKIKEHIQAGDIYEMNFCQEFYSENCNINAGDVFRKLNELSPAPFSAFYKLNDKHLICASPERFLKKTGNQLISQPIKGTIARGKDSIEDKIQIEKLLNDPKERSENVMIVDLVRNDLSKTAKQGSVNVNELFGIYEFPQVFQMISTIESEVKDEFSFSEVLKSTFPMGSMTGAPKIRAMEIIEQYERTKRGLYSGSVGYIKPNGDFDFNVVIRSLQYEHSLKYLSYIVGGAITSKSLPENEYQECLLKAMALNKVLAG